EACPPATTLTRLPSPTVNLAQKSIKSADSSHVNAARLPPHWLRASLHVSTHFDQLDMYERVSRVSVFICTKLLSLSEKTDECGLLVVFPRSRSTLKGNNIRVFEKLTIYFHGFDDDETKGVIMNVIENGGLVVMSSDVATHCVLNSAVVEMNSTQRMVTKEWFWNLIRFDYTSRIVKLGFSRSCKLETAT
ncbi:unnamed protein product, partial [Heligmosomoides polygyrus]|uniref:BRCT domain-containing protein n=1 Tax=Heligmosomoides polygyrus TaxID=6339 RepID=A0A183FAD4_HELPZ